MGKFIQQINLLTRKNLKVRFAHCCVTFCELFIPLLITAIIGLLTSIATLSAHGGGHRSSPDLPKTDELTPDEKFNCDKPSNYWDSTLYKCDTRYEFINSLENMIDVSKLKVQYVLSDKIIKQGKSQLAEMVMSNALKVGGQRRESSRQNATSNWTRSGKTEKELEICVMQLHDQCREIFAAIVIDNIQDAVQHANKFVMEYKIRLTDKHQRIDDFYTNRLFADFRYRLFDSELDQLAKIYFGQYDMSRGKPDRGFVTIQAFLDRGITEYIKSKYGHRKSEQVFVSLVRMPYLKPPTDKSAAVSKFISLLYSLLASLTIFSLMRVNSEKYSGFKELLRMHGVTTFTQWMAWLFSSFLVYSIWTFCLTMLLYLPLVGGPNLLMVLDVNFIIYWILLLLFTMSITTYCFLVSVHFERVWTAASIGLVIWIMLIVFMMMASSMFFSLKKWVALVAMLVPTVAFDFAFRLFLNGGATFRTMAVPVIENVPLTTLHCLFMLLLDSCIFMTLTLYLDNVHPAKYGVKKPPLYFVRDFKRFIMKAVKGAKGSEYQNKNEDDDANQDSVEMTSIISQDMHTQQPFEPDPQHVEASVVIRNLRKEFKRNKKRAVDGLSAKMFTGEIYTLLGFNGAGKTTTIGVLTGLTAPTDGVARIFDLDIRKDMEEIRRYIGLCPQHNLLFDEMTVLEQVTFFGKLKGINAPEGKAEELLKWLGMSDKCHNKPEELSGGQKRRVHLAIALIGDTKLAFLDEPTSGLDPETRRGVWDILLKLRGKMTVILTTHDMEEADVLGDRIGIMSEGKMMCSGTPSFLKKYYGVGYNLKMSASGSPCDPEKVVRFTQNYVTNAKLNTMVQSSAGQLDSISISLPTADLDLNRVADLMDALREQKDQLSVENIGLSLSTMNEVFLKVGEVVHAVTVPIPASCEPSTSNVSSSRYVGSRLQWYRFTTLLVKRMLYFCSAPFTLLFMILFFSSILWLCLTTLSFAVNIPVQTDPPRVVSSLSSYTSPVILLHDDENFIASSSKTTKLSNTISYTVSYLSQLHQSKSQDPDSIKVEEFSRNSSYQEIMSSLKKASIEDIHYYRKNYIAGASFNNSINSGDITGFFSAYSLHSAPLSYNLISQTLIKKMFGVDASIRVVNHPFKKAQNYDHITPYQVERANRQLYYFIKCGGVILLVVITSLLTGTAALLPTEERLNKGKQLQLMTGTTPFIYWMSMFTWDFLFFSFVNVIITLVYVLADYCSENWLFTNHGAGAVIFLILECHSFAALWFCYLISWASCIKTASDSFLIVNKLALIVGVLWNITRHLLISMTMSSFQYHSSETFGKVVYMISRWSCLVNWVVPMYSLYQAMMKLGTMSIPNSLCNWFPAEVIHLSCDVTGVNDRKVDWFVHSCCKDCKENCFEPKSYFNVSSIEMIEDLKSHSMIFDILGLILSGILCAGVLFYLEYVVPESEAKKRIAKMASASTAGENTECLASNNRGQDEDVVGEAARVEDIVKDSALETANYALIAHDLHLEFGDLKAVKGLSFGVYRGECFGLLGVNGAGKTSAFRMITGDIFPSTGNMFSGGLNYYKHRVSYLSSLGYCPQFDGIIGSLSGLQMVKLYGALRGIPPERLKEDGTIWLDKFGLLGSATKKCAKYSGGMKRRLSAAMALIGNPKLLLLDEPTTGVDPAFRRQFWNVIREIRESGQSVVLTSHTMDECEALCTRLGIMVDGQFRCLGNIQHLKSKFGKGYILTVKLKRVPEEEEAEQETRVNLVLQKIVEEFSRCRIQSQQKTMVQYQIFSKLLWYSDIFRKMEQIRGQPEALDVIEEYSVTETSLEDIFISFASQKQQ